MDKFDELKFLHERTQRFSERRQITSQTYLTINTVIFGAIAFLLKDAGLQEWYSIVIGLPFFGVGLLVCMIWYKILRNLELIIDWHYQQLREIERKVTESHLTFNKEWEEFYKEKGRKRFSFSKLESQLPRILMVLYTVYGVSLGIAAFLS